MASLLDIVPTRITVPVGTTEIAVQDVPFKDIISIMVRFPEVVDLFSGKGLDTGDLSQLILKAPTAVAAIIAAGVGKLGDEGHEAAAQRLGIEAQLDLLVAIYRATLPGGARPLVEKLKALGLVTDKAEPAAPEGMTDVDALRKKAQAASSPKPSAT